MKGIRSCQRMRKAPPRVNSTLLCRRKNIWGKQGTMTRKAEISWKKTCGYGGSTG